MWNGQCQKDPQRTFSASFLEFSHCSSAIYMILLHRAALSHRHVSIDLYIDTQLSIDFVSLKHRQQSGIDPCLRI